MNNQVVGTILLFLSALNVHSSEIMNFYDLSSEEKKCILMATEPKDRAFVKFVLEKQTLSDLSEEQKIYVIKIFNQIKGNFKSIPAVTDK